MLNSSTSPEVAHIHQLLSDYSFDTEAYPAEAIIAGWLQQFEPIWINHAITEALYQGRYKLISVEQILQLWHRRGHPIRHFNREFESIILGQALLCPSGYGDGSESSGTSVAKVPLPHTQKVESPKPAVEPSALSPTPPEPASNPGGAEPDPKPEGGRAVPLTQEGVASGVEASVGEPGEGSAKADGAMANFHVYTPDFDSAWIHVDTIQPFVPQLDGSGLHQRLKAVVQGGMRE
ncbi:MAG: hypothetical protein HC922_09445 [Leptolyngbyaceae cyanobacterium SM2_3_12]|nr:hypothetical protein [Leptolyngbyaceae cyanobacterium SM2_3_12]